MRVCVCKIYLMDSETMKVMKATVIFGMEKYMSISKKGCKGTISAEAPWPDSSFCAFEQCFSFLHWLNNNSW